MKLTTEQAALYIGCKVGTLHAHLRAGHVPGATQEGGRRGRWTIDRDALSEGLYGSAIHHLAGTDGVSVWREEREAEELRLGESSVEIHNALVDQLAASESRRHRVYVMAVAGWVAFGVACLYALS